MPLKKRHPGNHEIGAAAYQSTDPGAAAYRSTDPGSSAAPTPLQLDVTAKEHFIAQQAGVGRKLFGTDPADKAKTHDERLAIGNAVLDVLRDPSLTPQAMIQRLRQTEALLEQGQVTQDILDEVGAPTAEDIAKLTQLLGTEPDDNEVFTYLVAKATAEQELAKERAQTAEQATPATGLGAIPLISSDFDFELGGNNLDSAVEDICAFAENLTSEQAQRLYMNLRHSHVDTGIGQAYGADFDVSREIGEQIAVVRAMRARLLDDDGRLTARFSAKEAKEILGASNALNQTIMKFQKEITNFQRLIKVETAVKAALDTLPREAQDKYLEVLTALLAGN